jgi:hypothetical protein
LTHDALLPKPALLDVTAVAAERAGGDARVVPIAALVGTVDRERDCDRHFRPTSIRVRNRREQIAAATRRGAALSPVDLIEISEIHFVRDDVA